MNWYIEVYEALSSTGLSSGIFGDLVTSFLATLFVACVVCLPLFVIIWFLQMVCGRR